MTMESGNEWGAIWDFGTGLHPVPESLAFQSRINENCLGLSVRGFTNQNKKVKLKEVRSKKKKMDIYETIKKRRSVRAYKSETVAEDKLKRILEAVRLAPSAHNSQPYKLIMVKDEEKKQHLAKASQNQFFVAEASIIIAGILLEPKEEMALISLAIAIDHLTLAAAAEGLGTCWIGAFSQEEVKKILNIPEKYKVAILMPLGIPADSVGAKERKTLENLICNESFKE